MPDIVDALNAAVERESQRADRAEDERDEARALCGQLTGTVGAACWAAEYPWMRQFIDEGLLLKILRENGLLEEKEESPDT